jgi:glycosyltransferase involved in cell wall biosynthesis
MRILSVGRALGRGGTERALETFSLAYQRLGHSVAVLAWQEGGARQARLEQAGIEVFVGGRALPPALDAAAAFRPDLVHIHRVGVASAAELAILRRLQHRDRRILETNVFGRVDLSEAADHIDVHMHLSKWCLWRWRRWLRTRRSLQTAVVVGNPIDPGRFRRVDAVDRERFRARLGLGPDTFVCGRVGQPNAANWHPAIFTAFAALVRRVPDSRLVLLGLPASLRRTLGRLPDNVRRRVVELPLTDDDGTLSQVYSSFDCFLHAAAFGESFGYVLAESMLCECPAVTASTPHVNNSQVEVVRHLKGGVVAASLDALGAALAEFHVDRHLRDSLRPQLRDHVVSRFAMDTIARRVIAIGTTALENGDRSTLARRISEIPGCQTRVDDAEITELLTNSLGTPRMRDRLEMFIRHRPLFQRVVDAHLARQLDRRTDATLGHGALAGDSPPAALASEVRRGEPQPAPPIVTAVMPAYNAARHIGEAIDSVLAQTMSDWELVIVDDGSTDDTMTVLQQYQDPRIRIFHCQVNQGRAAARNIALARARGRYIAVCDADDRSEPIRFERQATFLDAHPEIGIVSGQLAHFASGHPPRLVVRFPESSDEIRQRLARGSMGVAHGASMLRVECFRQFGGYCPDLRSAEDLELFRRFARHCAFATLPDVLVAYRHQLPDLFAHWMASARHRRYALYRSESAESTEAVLPYDEFSRRLHARVLHLTVDVARFTVWSLRSRLAGRAS